MSEITCHTNNKDEIPSQKDDKRSSQQSTSHQQTTFEKEAGSQNFCRRQLSRHLHVKRKEGKNDKQVQTLISGDFFVNTANVYSGHLVE
jgi:hypothetical protein